MTIEEMKAKGYTRYTAFIEKDLYNRYVFSDDGSPCGELMEE